MENQIHVQVQGVLYHHPKQELNRALQTLCVAAVAANNQGISVSLSWGDASDTPIFPAESWKLFMKPYEKLEGAEYHFFHENTGYGEGNNRLALRSKADYLLIMNPEILLPPDAILSLLAIFKDPEAGIAEARQIPVEHPKEFDPLTYETPWASGACFMIPKDLFLQLHGFDSPNFFMYCEDVDLSWRVREAGKKIIYQPLTGVFHPRRLSVKGTNQPSKTEQMRTVLSEAMLAYKWSYPEYARERIRMAVEMGIPGGAEAQAEFFRREEEGSLPFFLDPEHQIAKITQFAENGGMLFARHRYTL